MIKYCKRDGTELCRDPEHNRPCGTCVLLKCPQAKKNEKERFVVGVARKGQFDIMENMSISFGSLKDARAWLKGAQKSKWYEGGYFTIFKEVEFTAIPTKKGK
jgi:hypothetical protein